ncbi:MAG: DUF455 family protein [Rhizobiales bacterium]|nr:DUF455 family protein [Hyphomicrobiales bacterium]
MPYASEDGRGFGSLAEGALAVLNTANADEKANCARLVAAAWRQGALPVLPGTSEPCPDMPSRPARPAAPELVDPRHMPRRSFKGARGRIALLHAIAHIELNAIDLAFDMIGRFCMADMPKEFLDDWVSVGDDEARHFAMLQHRLRNLGASYGDHPAHDGLWQAAEATANDLLARLAVVPMVLEARGLDVTPGMIERLTRAQDSESASVLSIIYEEEKRHVMIGAKWFAYLCARADRDPEKTFHSLVRLHFRGLLKPPFNTAARKQAGMMPNFYEPLAERPEECA